MNFNTKAELFNYISSLNIKPDYILERNDLSTINSYESEDYVAFEAATNSESTLCRCCGSITSNIKDKRITYPIIGTINDKPVLLKLHKKIYHCYECNTNTSEKIKGIERYAHKANEFIKMLLKSINDNTYSAVARRYKISCTNVILHFDKYRHNMPAIDVSKVENIGIDEVRFIPSVGNYQCVIYDHDKGNIIDILENRYLLTVTERLYQFNNLKSITQDFWDTYRRAAQKSCNNINIIADKFHLARFVTWAFNRTRVRIQKETNLKLGKKWKLQTKSRKNLSKLSKRKLDMILSQNEELNKAYQAKEFFFSILKSRNSEEYLMRIDEWITFIKRHQLDKFYPIMITLKNWNKEIINMFDSKLSNGAIERANRTIKQAKNNAYGFKNLSRATDLIKMRIVA